MAGAPEVASPILVVQRVYCALGQVEQIDRWSKVLTCTQCPLNCTGVGGRASVIQRFPQIDLLEEYVKYH